MDNLFFILSKLAWGLLSPTSLFFLLILFATSLLWCNYIAVAKRLLLILSASACLLWGYPVSDWLMHPLETHFSQVQHLPSQVDGIIVLGGAEDLKLSQSWQTAEVGQGAERILIAATLARHYPQKPLLYSGGSNLVQMADLSSVHTTAQSLLMQAGVEAHTIILETQSRNTYENFLNIKPLLPKQDGHYLLVTSAYHMPRAVGIAQTMQINVLPYPVDYRSSQPAYRYWDFDLFGHLSVLETAWHEWLGLTVYYLTGKTATWLPQEATHDSSTLENSTITTP